MAVRQTESSYSKGTRRLVSFLGNLLILVIGFTVLTLLLYRILWMWNLMSGTFNPEGADEYQIGRLVLQTGDPGVVLCLVVLMVVAITFVLLPAHNAPKWVPRLALALKVLAVYSVIMIVEQIWFIGIARTLLRLPDNLIFNGTYLTLDGDVQDGGEVLLKFYDPHYYTLIGAMLGLAVYWAPALVREFLRRVSKVWSRRS